MKKIIYAFLLLGFSATIYSCFKNPVTGRSSLSLVDETTLRQMATQEYTTFLTENVPVKGTRDAEMVSRVGNKIAEAVKQYLTSINQQGIISNYQWEFNLVNKNEANAWCMPGGKVVVYSGIMPIVQNEAGLAVVMGHEIAHAIARHSNERASQQMAAQYGTQAAGAVIANNPTAYSDIIQMAVGYGAQGTLLKFSRDQESEADKMGLIFMAMAGYNPNEAVTFWQRMASQSGGQKPPEILSSHPSDSRRIADIQKNIPEAMKHYKQ